VPIEEMRPASIHRYHGTQRATHNLQLKIAFEFVFFSIYSLICSIIIVARGAMSETSMKYHFSNTVSPEFYNVYVKDSTLQILNSSTMFKLQGTQINFKVLFTFY
jgi:hypothetical protein